MIFDIAMFFMRYFGNFAASVWYFVYPFKQFWYSLNFRCGTAVFHDFPPGIAVQSTPQCPPLQTKSNHVPI